MKWKGILLMENNYGCKERDPLLINYIANKWATFLLQYMHTIHYHNPYYT